MSSSPSAPQDATNIDVSEAPVSEPSQLTMEAITAQGNKIRLVDSDPDNGDSTVDLYCYVKCSANENNTVKACRGAVVSGGKILLQTFGFTPELVITEREQIIEAVGDLEGARVFDSHEGSLLRVFNVRGKWYVSTHRKLDAYRSKWASRESFGEIFEAAVNSEYNENETFHAKIDAQGSPTDDLLTKRILLSFFAGLDAEKCYCFLVRNTTENRIVCQPPERPTLYHVGTFDAGGSFSLDVDVGVPHPAEHTFSDSTELLNHAEQVNEDELQGLIVFQGSDHVKIVTKAYADLFAVRGNEPSIKYRYLQVRMDTKMTDLLYQLYPRYTETFEDYENKLYAIAQGIYGAYVQRFIKKSYVTVPKEEYQVMRACHAWHLEDRSKNRISQRKVVEKLNEQTPTNLNKMIRHYATQQDEDKRNGIAVSRYPRTPEAPRSPPPLPVSPPPTPPPGRAV